MTKQRTIHRVEFDGRGVARSLCGQLDDSKQPLPPGQVMDVFRKRVTCASCLKKMKTLAAALEYQMGGGPTAAAKRKVPREKTEETRVAELKKRRENAAARCAECGCKTGTRERTYCPVCASERARSK